MVTPIDMQLRKVKGIWITIGSVLLVLIIARLMLPYFVTRYVNKVLSEIPGYEGSISGVDIHLIRGAYVVKDLKLFKINGNDKVPFVDIPVTDLSVEWGALFKGAVVGEVIFEYPKLNFIGGDGKGEKPESENQSGTDVDWTEPIKKLMPLQINRMEIVHGSLFFYDFTTKPTVNLHLDSLQVLATNLNNAEKDEDPLPSAITARATSIGGGRLDLEMDINVLKKIPDLDMDLKFESINMPALNDFFVAYSKVDVEQGSFSLYSEMTIYDGDINGYVKPIARGMKIVNWKKDKQNLLNLAWQAIVAVLVEVFENQKKDQFASKIPLQGNLKDIDAEIWPTVWNVFRNAFVKAFEMNTENAIQFVDSDKLEPDEKSAQEQRKEKRRMRRAAKTKSEP